MNYFELIGVIFTASLFLEMSLIIGNCLVHCILYNILYASESEDKVRLNDDGKFTGMTDEIIINTRSPGWWIDE